MHVRRHVQHVFSTFKNKKRHNFCLEHNWVLTELPTLTLLSQISVDSDFQQTKDFIFGQLNFKKKPVMCSSYHLIKLASNKTNNWQRLDSSFPDFILPPIALPLEALKLTANGLFWRGFGTFQIYLNIKNAFLYNYYLFIIIFIKIMFHRIKSFI